MSNDMVILSKSEIEGLVSHYIDDVGLKFMDKLFELLNKAQVVSGEPVGLLKVNMHGAGEFRANHNNTIDEQGEYSLFTTPQSAIPKGFALVSDEVLKDAARYKWLKPRFNRGGHNILVNTCTEAIDFWYRVWGRDGNLSAMINPKGDEIDTYIDKAIMLEAAKKEG